MFLWRQKQKKTQTDSEDNTKEATENNDENEDEFNPTLAAMESEIKPKILQTVLNLNKDSLI